MSTAHNVSHEHTQEHEQTMTKRKIWRVFFYLLAITTLEFIIALYFIPQGILSQDHGNYTYIGLTILKAFYIVAYFMHLKFEKSILKVCIIFPIIFIIYLVIIMLMEGEYLRIHMN